jgi:hypothetical protein
MTEPRIFPERRQHSSAMELHRNQQELTMRQKIFPEGKYRYGTYRYFRNRAIIQAAMNKKY